MFRALLSAVILFICITHADAASFGCYGKLSQQERLICDDSVLSALDYRLNAVYSVTVGLTRPGHPLRAEQRRWLTEERARCTDTACLSAAYEKRLDKLWKTVQEYALPIPPALAATIRHPPTKSPYCEVSGAEGLDGGDWFELDITVEDQSVKGTIDGIFDCGRKVWGPIAVDGKLIGNVAKVEFETGWSEKRMQRAEALVVVALGRIYWHMLTEIKVENYVPVSETIPVQKGKT